MRHLLLAFALGCAPSVPRSTPEGTAPPAGDGADSAAASDDSGTAGQDGGVGTGDDTIDDVGGSALQLDHPGGWVDDGPFTLTVTTALVGADHPHHPRRLRPPPLAHRHGLHRPPRH